MNIQGYGETNKGRIRDQNEDAILFVKSKEYTLAAVADGMGGHIAGEVASALAIQTIKSYFLERAMVDEKDLIDCFTLANDSVYERSRSNEAYNNMGCTLSLLVILKDRALWAHIGDSRIYTYESDLLMRITQDHTLAHLSGGHNGYNDHILTRALGVKPTVEIDAGSFAFIGDSEFRFLLCSDGLYDMINEVEISDILHIPSPYLATKCLIAISNHQGGKDNISAIVIDKLSAEQSENLSQTKEIKIPV